MTPCGLRPFEPQCLWYDVSNWLPSVPCVTGMPNGLQAHHRLCYRPPYTQSLLTTPSITTAALRMASGKMRSSASFSILIATQPIARCMHGLSNSLTRANLPSSPACPASLLLAQLLAPTQSNLQGCVPRQWLFSPSDRKTRMMHACMHRARGQPQA